MGPLEAFKLKHRLNDVPVGERVRFAAPGGRRWAAYTRWAGRGEPIVYVLAGGSPTPREFESPEQLLASVGIEVPPACDFCSTLWPTWECPARDYSQFIQPDPGRGAKNRISSGAWMACDGCAALVRSGRRRELVDRSLTRHIEIHQELAAAGLQTQLTLRALIRQQHDRFWAHREGAPVRAEGDSR